MRRTNIYLLTATVAAALCIAFGLPPRAARAQSANYYSTPVYFPTPGPEPVASGTPGVPASGIPADGKMLCLPGTGLNTLAGQAITLGIGAPHDATYLLVSIFDADTSGAWDVASAPEDTLFALYADPNDTGQPNLTAPVAGTNPVTGAAEPGPWSGNAIAADPTSTSNGWSTVAIPLIPSDPAATNPARNAVSGNYLYQLRATLTNPTANAYNAFKVRVQAVFGRPSAAQATVTLNQQAFGFICPNTWPAGLNPDGKFSAYDGVWNFYMDVPQALDHFGVWDGDMDCGSMNADGTWDMAGMDTDDVDTNNATPYDPSSGNGIMKFSQVAPNAGEWVPYWAEGTNAVTQGAPSFDGIRHGTSPGLGATIQDPRIIPNPADNNACYRPTYVRRTVQPYISSSPAPGEPGVCYSVFDPLGREYINPNPSGNREWEQFKIAVDAAAQGPLQLDPSDSRRSQQDFVTDSLPAGTYLTQFRGVDVSNFNALHFDYRLVGVNPVAQPVPPVRAQVVVGDTVYRDVNADGTQQGSEPGISGVAMELRDASGTVLATAVTDTNGKYQFTLPSLDFVNGTNWTVKVAASNFAAGGALSGLTATTAGGNTQTHRVATDDLTYDFGYSALGSIGDCVWLDQNDDRIQAATEAGIQGVQVKVVGAQYGVTRTATTDANGHYTVAGLPGDTYTVSIVTATLPANVAPSYDLGGLKTPNVVTVPLAGGQNRVDVDWGYYPLASIGDTVWVDRNGNGIQDAGEPGIAGVQVKVTGARTGLIGTFTTDTNGHYSVGSLQGDTYTVQVIAATLPSGVAPIYDVDGTATPNAATAPLAWGQNRHDVNFGYQTPNISSPWTTYTQGGWGSTPNGNNPGALLAKYFPFIYGSSVRIGGNYQLNFTSAAAVLAFLPQSKTPTTLTANATNPTGDTNVLAGQVLALRLNVDFSAAAITRSGLSGLHLVSGKLAGYSVGQVLSMANTVLGGNTGALPAGVSISDLNNVVTLINQDYDHGTTNAGYLK